MRVFWCGMHKLLIQTELPRLRHLGLEVFCPRYESRSSQHQSASSGWTPDQPSTLPKRVFKKLSAYHFFYNAISDEMAEILDEYFDAVIVTIDPTWLMEMLRVYKKKLIFRTYGHVVNMSNHLFAWNGMRAIIDRHNFWYVPHSIECASHEHSWLRERKKVVPYCVTQDILSIKDTWNPLRKEIMISCPNLANPYFAAHYEYLKKHFSHECFRYYGVQTTRISDSQVRGTLRFSDLLAAYSHCAGFLYTYREPTVCFLPPIEMMIAGGPVIYLEGSLLDQYFGDTAPGRARDENEAIAMCRRLLSGDSDFANSLIASQESVRDRYLPEKVWPLFDRTFAELLSQDWTKSSSPRTIDHTEVVPNEHGYEIPQFVLMAVVPDPGVVFEKGSYVSTNPTSKIVKQASEVLSGHNSSWSLVCHKDHIPLWWGMISDKGKVVFLSLDSTIPKLPPRLQASDYDARSKWIRVLKDPTWALRKVLSRLGSHRERKASVKYEVLRAFRGATWLALDEHQEQTLLSIGINRRDILFIGNGDLTDLKSRLSASSAACFSKDPD